MVNTVEIKREDWDKLIRLHEDIGRLLFEAQDTLNGLLHFGVEPTSLMADVLDIHRRMKPIAKSVFIADYPFDIIPIRGGTTT